MSRREPKAGEWLRQQIDELGALRNASVRDPQFKAWRQNTLTFIQRIWPGDTTKSERFRRVPFTPPSTKHDPRAAREYYERGCGEALEYLNALLASLGGAQAEAPAVETERHPESFEGDFPEVDLGGGAPAAVGAAPPATLDESPIDLPAATAARGEGPPELPASAGRPADLGSSGDFLASAAFLDPESETPGQVPVVGGARPAADAARPSLPARPAGKAPSAATPPTSATPAPRAGEAANASRISVRGSAPREPETKRVNPLADILGPAREQARKDEVEVTRGDVHVRKDPLRETPREAAKDASGEAPRETAKEAWREAPREMAKEASREAPKEAFREVAKEAPREAPKNGKKKAKAPKPRLKDMLGLASLEQRAEETPAPPPAPAPTEADLTREAPMSPVAEAAESEAASFELAFTPPAAPTPLSPDVESHREIPVAPDSAPAFTGGVESSGGWSLPEFMTPHDHAHPPAEAIDGAERAVESEPVAQTEPVAESVADDAEPAHEALSAAHVESLPAEPAAPVTSDDDSGHAARVAAEFLDKSPVLRAEPRPVTRASRGSGAESARPALSAVPRPVAEPTGAPAEKTDDSVASRVLAIAAEVDQLGVPEGHRARARAALMDLARQLDESDVAWDVLRDAVHFVMEFPPLARRTLPLLLPYLDRAA